MTAAMLAPMATLFFLATLWLLVVLGAAILEESGAKIAAALKGKLPQQRLESTPIRLRTRSRSATPSCATAEWRAAA